MLSLRSPGLSISEIRGFAMLIDRNVKISLNPDLIPTARDHHQPAISHFQTGPNDLNFRIASRSVFALRWHRRRILD
jgi:hypothetical protein